VTYANEAKVDLLGVKQSSLDAHGAVSEEVAREMSEGALKNSKADIAVSVTGIAGPTGGSDEKPVGTYWLSISVRRGDKVETSAERKFAPNGREVFKQVASQAILMKILRELR